MGDEIKGMDGSQFKAFAEQQLDAAPSKAVKDRLTNLMMINSLSELTDRASMSIYDAALYKRFIYDTMGDPKNIKSVEMQQQGRVILDAMEKDLSAAEMLGKLDLNDPDVAKFVNSMNKGSAEANEIAALASSKN